MNNIALLTAFPFIIGTLLFLIPKRARGLIETVSGVTALVACLGSVRLFLVRPIESTFAYGISFVIDGLSGLALLGVTFFTLIIILYSIGFMRDHVYHRSFYVYVLWTLAASIGALAANHMIVLALFWGFLGLTLYLLIHIGGGSGAAAAAKKTFIIIGGSDAFLLFGMAIVWQAAGSWDLLGVKLPITSGLTFWAFIFFVLAAFAKAGAMPLHTWIPDCAASAPIAVTAYLPAALDKLLGIYLLARCCLDVFILNEAAHLVLLITGAVTIIAAVMMALMQHDMKKLLSYHAVSQVGYMVLGIGTGNPVGIAGGLFHMLNHAIYKCTLFLSAGSVEKKTGTTDLDHLGGLIQIIPATFVCALISSLSISGIPPFNGFVSKWMVYQGIVEMGQRGGRLWVLWLMAAMFGSALTLASFIKLLHAAYCARTTEYAEAPQREHCAMVLAMGVLAALCIVFGIFAKQLPLRFLINPILGGSDIYLGIWEPSQAGLYIGTGLLLGMFLYGALSLKKGFFRTDRTYIGGERLPESSFISGTDFYNTIKEIGVIQKIYRGAEKKYFDLYEQAKRTFSYMTELLRQMHTGVLPTYLSWVVFGLILLLWILGKNTW
ncbi:MAG: hypothetical protein JW844_05800 [Candidatus Omnitrophica bacterium]|nr:hypothetical protein [Candidatus Omnitrophota bacterium]